MSLIYLSLYSWINFCADCWAEAGILREKNQRGKKEEKMFS